jgi:hypothetical protein
VLDGESESCLGLQVEPVGLMLCAVCVQCGEKDIVTLR